MAPRGRGSTTKGRGKTKGSTTSRPRRPRDGTVKIIAGGDERGCVDGAALSARLSAIGCTRAGRWRTHCLYFKPKGAAAAPAADAAEIAPTPPLEPPLEEAVSYTHLTLPTNREG